MEAVSMDEQSQPSHRGPEAEELAGLFDRVYEELRAMAHRIMYSGLPGRTLQPTALVHEAYLRLLHGCEMGRPPAVDLEAELRYYIGEAYFYKGDYQQAILEFLKVPYLVTKKTKAVIVVHLYGCMPDMTAIQKLCKKHKLALIEDCAHQHGSFWKGQGVGSMSDVACVRSSTPPPALCVFSRQMSAVGMLWGSFGLMAASACSAVMKAGTWPPTRMPDACASAAMARST